MWQALKALMENLGFTCLNSDAGIFIFRNKDSYIIAVIYVDDALFYEPLKSLVLQLKEEFMKIWETRDLGDVTEFLHMCINRVGQEIHLDQQDYLRTVLQHCGMENAKASLTPLPARYVSLPLAKGTMASSELQSRYQTVIGSLLYLMLGTRPGVAFVVTKLAQYAANPSQDHLDKALYICCYLIGTQRYQLTCDGETGQGC